MTGRRTLVKELTDEVADNSPYDPDSGTYMVRDRLDKRIYLIVAAKGRRRLVLVQTLGDWPELTVDRARDLVARIGDLVSSARLIRRPVRRDSDEVNMAAE